MDVWINDEGPRNFGGHCVGWKTFYKIPGNSPYENSGWNFEGKCQA